MTHSFSKDTEWPERCLNCTYYVLCAMLVAWLEEFKAKLDSHNTSIFEKSSVRITRREFVENLQRDLPVLESGRHRQGCAEEHSIAPTFLRFFSLALCYWYVFVQFRELKFVWERMEPVSLWTMWEMWKLQAVFGRGTPSLDAFTVTVI